MRRRNSLLAALALVGAGSPAGAQELGKLDVTSVIGPQGLKVLAKPTDAEVMAAEPSRGKATGSAVMHCKVAPSGALETCKLTLERGSGFGAALLSLAPSYRVTIPPDAPEGDEVVITASWPKPDTPGDWQVKPKPGDFSITSTDAAWRSGQPGYAVMNCLQAKLGELHQCVVVYQTPVGKGFGTMLLAFQAYLKLKPAMLDGKPINSAVNFGFDFAAHHPGDPGKLP
jgi:hypothetical protein